MARSFTAASSHKLAFAGAAVAAPALSMACWANLNNATANHVLMAICSSSSDNPLFTLGARGDIGGDPIRASTRNDGASALGEADTSAGYSASTWFHAGGVWASTSSRKVYLNGGNSGTNSTAVSPTTLDRTSIGCLNRLTPAAFTDGLIAEAGIWGVALTDNDVAELAAGVCPLLVRPESLISYWSLFGVDSPEPDYVGGKDMTVTGAVIADHPAQVYVEDGPRIILPAAAGRPWAYRHLNRQNAGMVA
jgi:hypothetical protein